LPLLSPRIYVRVNNTYHAKIYIYVCVCVRACVCVCDIREGYVAIGTQNTLSYRELCLEERKHAVLQKIKHGFLSRTKGNPICQAPSLKQNLNSAHYVHVQPRRNLPVNWQSTSSLTALCVLAINFLSLHKHKINEITGKFFSAKKRDRNGPGIAVSQLRT